MSWSLIARDLSQGAVQATLEDLKRFATDEVTPVLRQTRQRVNDLFTKLNAGAIDFGVVKIRFSSTSPPTAADPNGSLAFTPSGVYSMQGGVWIALSAGGVTTFTAGGGMTQTATTGAVQADVVAANATITVNADSIQVGTITSSNIDSSIVADADIARIRLAMAAIRRLLVQLVRLEMGMSAGTGLERVA